METREQPAGDLHFVGKRDELIDAKRSFRTFAGRDIVVFHNRGAFFAMDSYCYHAGGLLQNGDIEEFDGKMCIVCPNHKYKITLANGEGLYKGTDPTVKPSVPRWYSKGVKQRIHAVTEMNGDVYVRISIPTNVDYIDSDFYQGEKGKLERAKAEAEEAAKKKKS